MKLVINYDLINKINDADRGYSLVRTTKKALIYTITAIPVTFLLCAMSSIPINAESKAVLSETILGTFTLQSIIQLSAELLLSRLVRISSTMELIELVQILKNIDVNTDYELLMKSYAYDTDYEFNFNKDTLIPSIEQKKYIMVPVYDNGEEKELSLLQEHIIGSKEYYLSIGEPKKVRKLVPSMA